MWDQIRSTREQKQMQKDEQKVEDESKKSAKTERNTD